MKNVDNAVIDPDKTIVAVVATDIGKFIATDQQGGYWSSDLTSVIKHSHSYIKELWFIKKAIYVHKQKIEDLSIVGILLFKDIFDFWILEVKLGHQNF